MKKRRRKVIERGKFFYCLISYMITTLIICVLMLLWVLGSFNGVLWEYRKAQAPIGILQAQERVGTLTTRYGHDTTSGIYYLESDNIEILLDCFPLSFENNLIHELGHFVSYNLDIPADTLKQLRDSEYHKITYGFYKYDNRDYFYNEEEFFALCFEYYFTDNARLKNDSPVMYEVVRNCLLAFHELKNQ